MITNINDNLKICGIYKINYDNNKIYIGQALNIWSRANEHNHKNIQICDQALKKHQATIEILEQVFDILQLDEIENKWINFYNATDKTIGYNILKNGNVSGKRGIENCNSKFNEQQLNEIINLLINNTKLSYKDIANLYQVSQNTILNISQGNTYFDPNLSYPLRQNNHDFAKKDNILDYFLNEQELLNLKEDLLYRWDLQIETDLVQKYKVPLKIIRAINQGSLFKENGNYIYPIRNKNVRNNQNFTIEEVKNILSDLRNSSKSMSDIGIKYNIHRDTVSKINKGKSYFIKNYDYPAR